MLGIPSGSEQGVWCWMPILELLQLNFMSRELMLMNVECYPCSQ